MSGEIAVRYEEGGPGLVTFRLLGAFQMTAGGQPCWAGPGQEQRLLVKLLAARNMPVANEELMGAIWDEVPGPGATLDNLHHLVTASRKRLAAAGLERVLINENGKYRLDIPVAHVDVHVFHALTVRARELARAGDRHAVALFEEALRLRCGEPLAGLRGLWIDGYRHTLAEELHAAELALYETAIRHDQSRERLPGLSTLLRNRPDDELVAWLYMHALYRADQQTQALAVKRQFSEHLLEMNGVENSKALDDLYRRILSRDDDLLVPEAIAFPTNETGARARQLGRQGPRAAADGEREEPHEPREDSTGGPQAGPADGERRETPAGASSFTFNGPVDARGGVIGTQVNFGGRR